MPGLLSLSTFVRLFAMSRYFFDIQTGHDFILDEEGLDLPNHKAAEIEAMQELIGLARDSIFVDERPDLAIEVRSATERLFCASLVYRITSIKQ
jgi:Domain of unknown function (DUF6894)